MKSFFYLTVALYLLFSVAGCSGKLTVGGSSVDSNDSSFTPKLGIETDGHIFEAIVYDNSTAQAFIELLPITLNMSDMPHEKYYYLNQPLPSAPKRLGKIEAGDLMLWGTQCLVLFYESFASAYSYTRIARIENPINLSWALENSRAVVTFSLLE